MVQDQKVPIKGCENALKSAQFVWKNLIQNSNHQNVGIIAHSYGGPVCFHLMEKFPTDFQERVFGVLLTDSAHGGGGGQKMVPKNVSEICINFVTSDQKLNTELNPRSDGIATRSAGHIIHEWTPSSSRNALFQAFDEFYQKAKK
jgi:hypothetical protein